MRGLFKPGFPMIAFASFALVFALLKHVGKADNNTGSVVASDSACNAVCERASTCLGELRPAEAPQYLAQFKSGCFYGCKRHYAKIERCFEKAANSCSEIQACMAREFAFN